MPDVVSVRPGVALRDIHAECTKRNAPILIKPMLRIDDLENKSVMAAGASRGAGGGGRRRGASRALRCESVYLGGVGTPCGWIIHLNSGQVLP